MILLSILILSMPTIVELIDDRNGETPEQKKKDVRVRALLMIVCAGVVTAIVHPNVYPWVTSLHLWPLTLTYLKCLFLSFAIFFMFFDYAINLILGRKPWFSYLSESPIDRLWSKVNWRWRLAIKGVVFGIALIWFLNK